MFNDSMDASAYIGIAIGILVSIIGYLAHRSIEQIDEDIKLIKTSQYNTGNRLTKIESTQATQTLTLQSLDTKTQRIEAASNRAKFMLDENIPILMDQNRTNQNDVNVLKEDFGKVILILRKLIQNRNTKT